MGEDNDNNFNKKEFEKEEKKKHQIVLESGIPDLDLDLDTGSCVGGGLRGIAAATKNLLRTAVQKAAASKAVAAKKTVVRAIGENRPLAFASEGAVAGESILPKVVYYGAWTLSGTAIAADIYTKQDDAPAHLKLNTALYWTAFHIPASLVVPAIIIHRIVHAVEGIVQNPKPTSALVKSLPPRIKPLAPVTAALLSIIPVVPIVDYTAETIMEPTLGAYLGLSFDHHHHHHQHDTKTSKKEEEGKQKQQQQITVTKKKEE